MRTACSTTAIVSRLLVRLRSQGGRAARLLGFLAALMGATAPLPALADELLVMPYTCTMSGGRPVLSPSRDQGHAVVGLREQRTFRSCSPANPGMCRQWTVHRFDLECDGARVPWVAVARAAGAHKNVRSWIRNGRLELEMPASWTLATDDICAREQPLRHRWRLRRYCAERLDRYGPPVVTMPAGFAPMFGIDGIFVAGDHADPLAHADPPAKAPPAKDYAAPEQVALADPTPLPMPNPRRRSAPEQPVPAPERAARPEKPAVPETTFNGSGAAEAANGSGAAAAAPIIPQIINGAASSSRDLSSSDGSSNDGSSGDAPKADAAASSSASKVAIQPQDAAEPAPPVPDAAPERVDPAPERVAEAAEPPPGDPLTTGSLGPPKDMAVMGAGALMLLSLLTVLMLARRGRTQAAAPLSRDIAAVSLGEAGYAPREARGQELMIPRDMIPAVPRQAGETLPQSAPEVEKPLSRTEPGDDIPMTREDALRILGIGVAPDMNAAAIKTIINGLRLSWHPDHATSAADRERRELRLKQINAAWEIISGGQAPATEAGAHRASADGLA